MTMSWFAPQDPPDRGQVPGRVWRSVLVPLDGSERSRRAVGRAGRLLGRPGMAVTLLHVIECGDEHANDLGYQMDPRHGPACKALAEVRSGFEHHAAEVSADVRFGDPATEILREIAESRHDLVLMSLYGRASLGGVARRVLSSSSIPVLLFRSPLESDAGSGDPTHFQRLLVALDGSGSSEEILPAAEEMARTLGSELHLFRAVSGGSGEGPRRLAAEVYLEKWGGALASRGIKARAHVRVGSPVESALALIRDLGLDSAALATRARTGLARAVFGSVTQELLREVDVPVLTWCGRGHRRTMPASARDHRRARVGG